VLKPLERRRPSGTFPPMSGFDGRDFSVMKGSREVILRIAAAHKDKRALDILGMELAYVFPTLNVINFSLLHRRPLE
jgi:hypothetical protein